MTNNNLTNAILYGNKFTNIKVNGDTIGAENFKTWETACNNLEHSLYNAIAKSQNYQLDEKADLNKVFADFRTIADLIGEVNGFKLKCNLEDALAVAPYTLTDGTKDAPEMQLAKSEKQFYEKRLKTLMETKGVNPKAIEEAQEKLTTAKAEVERLKGIEDMSVKVPKMVAEATFRLKFEHYLARKINGQLTRSYEELKAEEDAKKAERKAKRQAKRQAEAKAKAEAETK